MAESVSPIGIALQGIRLTATRFDQTPFLDRLPTSWIGAEDWAGLSDRMYQPDLYCPLTVNGYWGPASDRVVLRYMPCVDRGPLPGSVCAAHMAVIKQGPWPRRPTPAPLTTPVPPTREKARCRDCGDILPGHDRRRCSRCYKVWRQAEEARQAERDRCEYPPPVYRCLACRVRIELPQHGPQLCPTCAEQRYFEQPDEPALLPHSEIGDGLPTSTIHHNQRGEWVIGGRVVHHKPPDESRWDVFGDTPENDA
jgi:hypothetical protein